MTMLLKLFALFMAFGVCDRLGFFALGHPVRALLRFWRASRSRPLPTRRGRLVAVLIALGLIAFVVLLGALVVWGAGCSEHR